MSTKKFTLIEVTRTTGVAEERIEFFVRSEWVSPAGTTEFDEEDVARIKLIRDLQTDLGTNEESVPIILHLVDQIHFLQDAVTKLMKSE